MKKLLIISLFAFVLAFPLYVQAENPRSLYKRLGDDKSTLSRPFLEQERKEDVGERKLEFKKRLATIKDSRKKEIVERLDQHMNELNSRRTLHWLQLLERMEMIVTKVDERTDNPDVVDEIETAHKTIAEAKTTVQQQAEKTYTIEISDTEKLHESVKTTRDQLKTDLKAVHEMMKKARESVRNMLIALNPTK